MIFKVKGAGVSPLFVEMELFSHNYAVKLSINPGLTLKKTLNPPLF